MSIPIAFPWAPTFLAARNTSKPAPLPRSTTVSPFVKRSAQVPPGRTAEKGNNLSEIRDGYGIPTAETKICFSGSHGELFCAISKRFCYSLAISCVGTFGSQAIMFLNSFVDGCLVHDMELKGKNEWSIERRVPAFPSWMKESKHGLGTISTLLYVSGIDMSLLTT